MTDFDRMMNNIDALMPRAEQLVAIEKAASDLMTFLHQHVGDTEGYVRLIVTDDGDGVALAERLMALDRALKGERR